MNTKKSALLNSRLYVIVGSEPSAEETLRVAAAALRGGTDIIQVRAKARGWQVVMGLARRMRECVDKAGAIWIVNDDPVLAIESGADGVHVGQDDMPVAEVRRIVGDRFLVGLSTHSPRQALDGCQQPVDYIGYGPLFATPTKPDYGAIGLDALNEIKGRIALPWFAIGGIDAGNVGSVRDHGARRAAVVRAVTRAKDPEKAAAGIKAMLTQTEKVHHE